MPARARATRALRKGATHTAAMKAKAGAARRDEFSAATKRHLRDEVGNVCTLCARPTSGPSESKGSVLSCQAGHIRGARKGGPRWDETMTSAARRSAANGISLCATCHVIVDGDQSTYTVAQLEAAKRRAVDDARRRHVTGNAPGPDASQIAVASAALKAANLLCARVQHALRASKRASEAAKQGPRARADADAWLEFAVEEMTTACDAYTDQIENVRARFPKVFQPVFLMMQFRDLAATVAVEFHYQWRGRFHDERRLQSAMDGLNPFDTMCDWSKAFEGVEHDAQIVDAWAVAHGRRMTSWAAHIGRGLAPEAWWPLRQEEERLEMERLKERARDRANGHPV